MMPVTLEMELEGKPVKERSNTPPAVVHQNEERREGGIGA